MSGASEVSNYRGLEAGWQYILIGIKLIISICNITETETETGADVCPGEASVYACLLDNICGGSSGDT
jgi:hypothetical protein